MKHRKPVIFILFASLLIFQACTTRSIRIDPMPELKIGSPLSEIKPLTFKINEFEDARSNKNVIGVCRVGPKIKIEDQKVSEIVAQAIANELKRNGHAVVGPGESGTADVIIDGIVRGYWIQHDNYTWSIKITGKVETEIKAAVRQSSDNPLLKTYRGSYYYETSGVPSSGLWLNAINQALLDMLKEFTTDEEFLSRIKQARRQSP